MFVFLQVISVPSFMSIAYSNQNLGGAEWLKFQLDVIPVTDKISWNPGTKKTFNYFLCIIMLHNT